MQEHKWTIAFIMAICIIIVYILEKVVEYKLYKKEVENFEQFKGNRNLTLEQVCSDKGLTGEFQVFNVIKSELKGNFKLFNNVYLPKKDNKVTEVDLIAIHEKGIFIVEVKNLYGVIKGLKDQYQWLQVINEDKEETFYNPIIQNKNHIKYFKENIDIKELDKDIYSIIVFGDKSDISFVRYNEENTKLININEIGNVLNNIVESKEIILNENQIEEICLTLEKCTHVDNKIIEKHLNDILEYN